MAEYQNTNMPVIMGNYGYAIFFDNIRVDQFVENFSVNLGIEIGMGNATINMIYVPDFDKVIHTQNSDKVSNMKEQAQASPTAEVKSEKVTKAEVINCTALTVRNGPSTDYKPITYVKSGTKLTVIAKGSSWTQVKTSDGKTGYVSTKYVRVYDETVTQKVSSSTTSSSSSTSKTEKSGNISKLGDTTIDKGLNVVIDDGIENMTNVRIYLKNTFSGKYQQVFAGNITAKSITISGGERKLSFTATDYMNWLNKTICPIAVPLDSTLALGDRLKWKAQGIDINKVATVSSVNEVSFKGKNIAQTWQSISEQAMRTNALYTDKDSIAYFDNPLSKVVVMGDIDENLRKKEVLDFLISSSVTSVNSVYVLMNDILRELVFEFYQDIDESIKIKPPFWNQHVLKSHVIDAGLIHSYTESTNYNYMYTRVIATGGLDEWHRTSDDQDLNSIIQTPVVAVTSSGIASNSGPTVLTTELQTRIGMEHGSNISTSAVQIAKMQEGKYYIWGAEGPDTFDCSGLIDYCYRKAGYQGFGGTRQTTSTLKNKGRKVVNINDLCPGDLLFPNWGHVQMYIGSGKVIGADGGDASTNTPTAGKQVKITNLKKSYVEMRRLVEWDGIANVNEDKEIYTDSVGDDALLKPTLMEKKYGPRIYDCSQPLIKFSTSSATSSSDPYDALSKYARFMLNYLNSNVVVSSIQTVIAMPWIRPGFNIWVDPVSIDKIYYVNAITHQGSPQGVYTTINGTMGRRRNDFVNNKDMIGCLNPGKSDDIFINEISITPEKYGTICDYNDIMTRCYQFYNTQKTEQVEANAYSPYYTYLYGGKGVDLNKTAAATTTTTQAATTTQTKPINKGVVTGVSTYLNVRSGPGTSHPIIGKIFNGDGITIHKESGGFYNFTYNGNTGAWVSANYIKKTSEPTSISQNNKTETAAPKIAAVAPGQALLGEFTINDIQYTLNTKFASANTPAVVKTRANRVKELVESANIYMARLYRSTYVDNPISVAKGGHPL